MKKEQRTTVSTKYRDEIKMIEKEQMPAIWGDLWWKFNNRLYIDKSNAMFQLALAFQKVANSVKEEQKTGFRVGGLEFYLTREEIEQKALEYEEIARKYERADAEEEMEFLMEYESEKHEKSAKEKLLEALESVR